MGDKEKRSKVLTGSTGNVSIDMTPRTAWVTLWTIGPGLVAAMFGADAYVTASAGTLGAAFATLSAAGFDAFVKPRL